AQIHNWQRTNPGGGGAFSTIGASTLGIIIAGSDLSGAYRSIDNGQTWDVIGASKGLTETHVSGLGFDAINGNILYIGTENGIFRSDNGGDNVIKVLNSGYITDVEFAPSNTNIGYATYHPSYNSTNGFIYKSINNGISWNQSSTNLPSGIRILKILINPQDENTVYILTGNGRFACGAADAYKSIDGGITWSNLTSTLPEILDIAIDINSPETIYITTMNANCSYQYYWTDLLGNLYKSTDGGASWNAPLSDYTGVIWLDPNNSDIIKLIDPREPYPWNSRAGTFTSTNGGITFTQTGNVNNWDTFFNESVYGSYGISFNGICKTLGKDLSNPATYFWINSQWVFKSSDNGTTFNNIFTDEVSNGFWQSRGFDNVNMMDISISKANPDIIYLAYFDMGIWRSLDQGMSWQSCNDDVFTGNWNGLGGNCATVLADPTRSNIVWASQSENQNGQSPTYLLKNTNTGNRDNWSLSNTGLPEEEIMGLSIDVNSNENNRILFITALKDVYKSTDDGNTWTQVLDCNGCRFTAVDKFNGNIVYAGGENGLWRSIDAGNSWTDVSHSEMYTNNNAEFWDWNYYGVFDIKTDPNNPNYVYATALGPNKGLFKSVNNGATWAKILTDDYMRKVAIVPQDSNLLYATSSSAFEAGGYNTNSNGVWFSENGGQTWTQQNQEMAYPFALAVAADNNTNPTVFVGSPGTGFQKSNVPITLSTNSSVYSSIKIVPNPTSNKIKITGNFINSQIIIFDITGKPVKKFPNIKPESVLQISNLKTGMYFLKFQNKKEKLNKFYKIIKQ
ncbi:MAG: VPS10 domain-containing protein, partial [Flavobacteriales bacterium]